MILMTRAQVEIRQGKFTAIKLGRETHVFDDGVENHTRGRVFSPWIDLPEENFAIQAWAGSHHKLRRLAQKCPGVLINDPLDVLSAVTAGFHLEGAFWHRKRVGNTPVAG